MAKNNVVYLNKPRRGCGSTLFLLKKIIFNLSTEPCRWFVYTANPNNIRDHLRRVMAETLSSTIACDAGKIDDIIKKYVTIKNYDELRMLGIDYRKSIVLLADYDYRQSKHKNVHSYLMSTPQELLIVEVDATKQGLY